jgi:integrase
MPIILKKRPGCDNIYMWGTHLGVSVRESTRTNDWGQAKVILAKKLKDIFDGHIAGPQPATTHFIEAVEKYLAAGGEQRFMQPLIDNIGRVPLAKINQVFVDDLAPKLYPTSQPASLNRMVYTPIIAVLTRAAKSGLCSKPTIERPEKGEPRDRWVTKEEAERLIGEAAPHLRPLVIFLFSTGARMGEALYLDWKNIDLVNRQVNFVHAPKQGSRTKTKRSRAVPLGSRVLGELLILRQQHGGQGAVFRKHDGAPYSRTQAHRGGGGQIDSAFDGMCRRAGIEDFNPHDCRHTWATWFYKEHRDLQLLQRLGGWASLEHVQRYAHLNVENLADSIEQALAGWGTSEAQTSTKSAHKLRVVGE